MHSQIQMAEYWKELQEPERRYWFERVLRESVEGTVALLHGSQKKASLITPEDTTVYYLKQFIDEALNARVKSENIARVQSIPAEEKAGVAM